MKKQQLNMLLDILQKRLKPSELKTLTFRVLGTGAYDDLPGNIYAEKCISLLETVGQREAEITLLHELAYLRPDVDLSPWGVVSELDEPSVKEPSPTPFIDFANRKNEWERVVLYPNGQYYLFCGPAGYGKTALLKKLEDEFKRRQWLCAYIPLDTYTSLKEIVSYLAQALDVSVTPSQDAYQSGKVFGESVIAKSGLEKGLALLFDVDHTPSIAFPDTLSALFHKFIPGIWDTLSAEPNFFRDPSHNYRIVLAGRDLAPTIDDLALPYEFDKVQLHPFDDKVVQDICINYLKDKLSNIQQRKEFAAHLLFYSGGHPRCMVSTLKLFDQCNLPASGFFTQCRQEIERIAYDEANWVRSSINQKWRSAFDALCKFRRFDKETLEQLMGQGVIWQGLGEDTEDLIVNLLHSYLVTRRADGAYKHFSDDITRRLLTIRFRLDVASGEFSDAYRYARESCLNHLAESRELRHIWALETLFSYLQANIASIDTLKGRQALRKGFFEEELPLIMGLLTKDRNPRSEIAPFRELLIKDWEFRFTLNYYLRDTMYTDQMYQDLVHYVEQFPTTVAK